MKKEGIISDPFRLAWRLFIASFRITGYVLVFIVQAIIYLRWGGRRYRFKMGDAAGQLGRSVTDALADVFRE